MTLSKLRLLLATLLTVLPIQRTAAFSSLYVFGDGVCTTTSVQATNLKSLYYGDRNCNGRVWVEVLAQWQGLNFDNGKNKSFFGHDSIALVNASLSTSVNNFIPPADVATALVVVWCNDADFVKFTQVAASPPYTSGHIANWTSLITAAVNRHTQAVNTLYTKGVRTIIMPKAANIAATPYYANLGINATQIASNQQFIRQRTIEFNVAFETAMANLALTKPGLVIHRPDTFTFFEQVLSSASAYGLVNTGIDAISGIGNPILTGPGASYIFWDPWHPTARFQMYLADLAQKMISPVKVNGISRSGTISQITIANIPLGRQGIVEGSSNLLPPWSQDVTFTQPFTAGGSTTGSVNATSTAPSRFYRVKFPVVWTWP